MSISFANKIEANAFAKERNNEHKLPPQLQFATQERIEFAKFRKIAIEKEMPLITDAAALCVLHSSMRLCCIQPER